MYGLTPAMDGELLVSGNVGRGYSTNGEAHPAHRMGLKSEREAASGSLREGQFVLDEADARGQPHHSFDGPSFVLVADRAAESHVSTVDPDLDAGGAGDRRSVDQAAKVGLERGRRRGWRLELNLGGVRDLPRQRHQDAARVGGVY